MSARSPPRRHSRPRASRRERARHRRRRLHRLAHRARALRGAGREVVVLDTLEFGHARAVIDAAARGRRHRRRRRSSSGLPRPRRRRVVHFAAYKNVGESMPTPSSYLTTTSTARSRCSRRCGRPASSRSCSPRRARSTARRDRCRSRVPRRSSPRACTPRPRRSSSGCCAGTSSHRGPALGRACATSTPPAPASTAAIGEDWTAVAQPRAGRDEGDARAATAGCRCSATTTRRPTARASATTSTSTTSPTPTSSALDYLDGGGRSTARQRRHRRRHVGDGGDRGDASGSAGRAGAARDRRPPRRRPGRHLRRPDPGARRARLGAASRPRRDHRHAWGWHSTHIDGHDTAP